MPAQAGIHCTRRGRKNVCDAVDSRIRGNDDFSDTNHLQLTLTTNINFYLSLQKGNKNPAGAGMCFMHCGG